MSIDTNAGGNAPRTMFEKIWDQHVVHAEDGKQTLLYIDGLEFLNPLQEIRHLSL